MPPQEPQQPQVPQPTAPQTQPQPVVASPQPTTAPQQPAYNTIVPTKKRIPKWLKIVGIIVIVFIAIVVIAAIAATTATKAPQKISDQFVNDVQSGNSSAAYSLTSKRFKQVTTEEQLDDIIQQVKPALQGQEKVTGRTIEKSTGIPTTAVLVYTVKTSDGNKYIKIELQEDNSVWQVIHFKSDNRPLDSTVE